MNLLQRMGCYSLVIGSMFGLMGCDDSWPPRKKAPEYFFIEGKVKGENYQRNIIELDRYTFSLETKNGLKVFSCSNNHYAPKFDALINPGDSVKLKLSSPPYKPENTEFAVDKKNLYSVNNFEISLK